MIENLKNQGMELFSKQLWAEAIPFFTKSLQYSPKQHGVLYMLGQCYRFIQEYDESIIFLKNAIALEKSNKHYFLALGISYQLNEQFEESLQALRSAHSLDPDFSPAYNSAGLTFRKMNKLDRAYETYDKSIYALFRNILNELKNSHSQKVIDPFYSDREITQKFIMRSALEKCVTDNIDALLLPTTEHLEKINQDPNLVGGLLWVDGASDIFNLNNKDRLYLPNFFNSMQFYILGNPSYFNTLKNKATVCELQGKTEECDQIQEEANFFENYYEEHLHGYV